MELSIIIPVYNTEINKLYKCFQSIETIKEIDFECLIIDDGSEKETGDFCREYVKKNKKFKYLYKKNGGVSSARNLGLDNAKGKWVYFVDSDDTISIENIKHFLKSNAELIFTDITMIDSKNRVHIWNAFTQPEGKLEVSDVLKRMVVTGIINGPVGKFIKSDFIKKNNIRFDESMIIGEDAVFLLSMLKEVTSMYYFRESSYIYYKDNQTSNTRMLSNIKVYIDNNYTMYSRMIDVICNQKCSIDDKKKLIGSATERYIKQLFNTAAELMLYKKMNEDTKAILNERYMLIKEENMLNIGIKTKIRYYIIEKKKWWFLFITARIRKIYLQIRK